MVFVNGSFLWVYSKYYTKTTIKYLEVLLSYKAQVWTVVARIEPRSRSNTALGRILFRYAVDTSMVGPITILVNAATNREG